MTHSFFITGTDTEVGKTTVTSLLLETAAHLGITTAALKPIASGCHPTTDGWRNADALELQTQATLPLTYAQVNPYAFAPAIAPHLAAELDGITIDLDVLIQQYKYALSLKPQLLVLEGAGGWRTPISEQEYLSDLAINLQLPVILVVDLRLGCLNHALLTAEAIRADGLHLAGWVANNSQAPVTAQADRSIPIQATELSQANQAYLAKKLATPCLAQIPFQPASNLQERLAYCANWLKLIQP